MASAPPEATRLTIYRLHGLKVLKDAIKDKHQGMSSSRFSIGDADGDSRECLLVEGRTPEKQVRWASALNRITGDNRSISNSSPLAVLLIPDLSRDPISTQPHAWAVTFGYGYTLLEPDNIDTGFGLSVALRTATPETISSLTSVTLDAKTKTERSSIPSGDDLRAFGFEDIGEIATRMVAKANPTVLDGEGKSITIRGAGSLNLPLSTAPDSLLRQLDQIAEILDTPPSDPDLALIDQTRQVKPGQAKLTATLTANLVSGIGSPAQSRLALAWPHEMVEEYGAAAG